MIRSGSSVTRRCLSTLPKFNYKVEDLYDTNYLNLPRLPLPSVQGTLKRYLETVSPLATPEELAHTARVTQDFETNLAPKLHAELVKLDQCKGYPFSYIETFWDEMYQGGRWPVMVNSNPFYVFEDEENPADYQQTWRAANLASGCLRWWRKVVEGKLEADMERDSPLCMYGFGYVFGTTRVPQVGRDKVVPNYHSKHIIVICHHQYYRVDVLDEKGRAISSENLKCILDNIKEEVAGFKSEDVGLLTTAERDFWAQARTRLVADSTNKTSVDEIDKCLFTIVLEEKDCSDDNCKSKIMLTGDDGSGRWFDKHSIIATNDGTLGMNFDHTFGDGMTWNRMVKEVFEDMRQMKSGLSPLPSPASDSFNGSAQKLSWNLSPESKTDIEIARKDSLALVNDVDTHVLKFTDFGRDRMKEMKVSPDAAAQLSFQLAYAKVHGKNAAVYEACAMKNYLHGRTETIRACSTDSIAMVSAFLSGSDSDTKRKLLQSAASTHINIAKGAKACSGPFQGVDRHLYAMKNIAARLGLSHPFFEDPLYSRTSTWILSTSNVTHPFVDNFGFGAVTGNGYGLGYMTLKNSIPVNITSYNSCPETSSKVMGQAIAESLQDFNRLF